MGSADPTRHRRRCGISVSELTASPGGDPHAGANQNLCWRWMDLDTRLTELYNDLGNQQGELRDSGALGKVFNGLLEEVRVQHGEDPVITEIDKIGFNFSGHTASSAESLRTVVGQMRTVVRGD